MVGQQMVRRLAAHPWFRVEVLTASQRSTGRAYQDAARWHYPGEAYAGLGSHPVVDADPDDLRRRLGPRGIVFSALDRDAAERLERACAGVGLAVVTNAGANRMAPDVPLLIPEVNPQMLGLLPEGGFIVANPNCTAMPVAMTLAPLRSLGWEAATVASWQAVSGAGWPGESAYDMLGNAHPHAGDEEEKLAAEPCRILGEFVDGAWQPHSAGLSARCVRVPVVDGHLVAVHARFRDRPTPDDVMDLWRSWEPGLDLPSAPRPPLRISVGRDRPSARWDADAGDGMAVTTGRVEVCPVLGVKWFALAHNTVRGAAGAALLNAELLVARGLVP